MKIPKHSAKSPENKSIAACSTRLIAGNTHAAQVISQILRMPFPGIISSGLGHTLRNKTMIFWTGSTVYAGSSAIEIVRKIKQDATDYIREGTVRDFIEWSLSKLSDHLPLRELAVSDRVTDETLALSYLCLLDQYGLGELDPLP